MSPKEQEALFQKAYDTWERSNYTDKKSFDAMFFRVLECCTSIAKKKATGRNIQDLEGKALDAASYYMRRIKKDHIHPAKLSSWCYLGTIGYLTGFSSGFNNTQLNESAISYEGYLEDHLELFEGC